MAVWTLAVTGTTTYTVPSGHVLVLKTALVRPVQADDTVSRWAALSLNGAPVASWDLRVAGGGLTAPARATDGQAVVLGDLVATGGEALTFQLTGNVTTVAGVVGDLSAQPVPDVAASTTIAGVTSDVALHWLVAVQPLLAILAVGALMRVIWKVMR